MLGSRDPLSVCLVTYNSGGLMPGCLEAFRQRPEDITIRVWDNGSTDGVTPRVLTCLKDQGLIDELHLCPDDPGFAVGANHLIRRSPGEAILLLNPDAHLDLDSVELLRQAADADPTLGVLSPVVSGDGDVQVMSAGLQPRLWPLFTHYSGLSKLFPRVGPLRGRHLFLASHGGQDQDVEWTSGACMFIPRSTVQRVGLLSERWFMYGEDLEYCQRVREAGLLIRIVAAAHAYHAVGASATEGIEELLEATPSQAPRFTEEPTGAGEPPDITGMWGRNTYDYYVRQFHPNSAQRLLWRAVFSGGLACRAAVRLVRNRQDRLAKKMLENAAAVW